MKDFLRHIKPTLTVLVLLTGLSQPHPAHASWWWPFGNDGLDYKIKFYGINSSTTKWFSSLKLDQPNTTTPPKNEAELEQEAGALAERLRKALEAKGYYDAILRQRVEQDKKEYKIVYNITPGPRYIISNIRMDWQDKRLPVADLNNLKTKKKDPVDVSVIHEDSATLLTRIGKDACLLSLSVNPLLRLYGKNHTAELVFRIAHGPKANFGKTIIKGTQDVNNTVILKSVKWKQGECFEQDKINSTQTALVENQLLSSVSISAAQTPNISGEVPITLTVKERVPRTITAGANYTTDQGFGITTGWEHRNLFGNGEKFNAALGWAQNEQFLNTSLRIPYFMRDDQTLVLSANTKREDQTAYTANSFSPSAMIERKLSPHLNSGLGVAYTLTQTEDTLAGKNNYGLLSFPGFLTYDTRNDTTDPRKGMLGQLNVAPYTETFGEGGQFVKTQIGFQTYFSSDHYSLKPTLALKLNAGSIVGADGVDVPSDLRFYAGGGGSVRGYSYQSLSPRLNNEPVGGSSMLAGSTELRLRFNESFGGVAFVDAGNAYDSTMPGGEKLYFGAGVGIRYYTAIGPVRADIGVPLNGKDIGETGYALYVSLGQAF